MEKYRRFYEPEDRREVLERLLESDNEAILVVRDDQIVGSAVILYNPFQSFVYRFSIDPNYQGKGIGNYYQKKLMRH